MCKVCRSVRERRRGKANIEKRRQKKIAKGTHTDEGFLIPEKSGFYQRNKNAIKRIAVVRPRRKRVADFAFFADCQRCGFEFRLSSGKVKRSNVRCGRCCLVLGEFEGQPIFSAALASVANKITRVVPRVCKGQKYNTFYIKCLYEGCKKDSRFINMKTASAAKKTMFCADHRAVVFRLTAYRHIYRNMVHGTDRDRVRVKDVMNFEEFVARCKETKCYYCGDRVERSKYNTGGASFSTFLDKINPAKGYTFDNTVTCCTFCNFSKGYLLTKEEMQVVALMRRQDRSGLERFVKRLNFKINALRVSTIHRKLFYSIHGQLRPESSQS